MNYELAKKLKDAGFPQRNKEGKFYHEHDSNCGDICDIEFTKGGTWIYFPTLSELIEACGEGFIGLIKVLSGFVAKGKIQDSGLIGLDHTAFDTPEEAVANLWLELKKLRGEIIGDEHKGLSQDE